MNAWSAGKYIISDKPMSVEQWVKERATLIEGEATDVTPSKEEPAQLERPAGRKGRTGSEM